MAPLVELKHVTFRTERGVVIFDDASLSLYPGERVLVYGPFSSGKGVLVKFLAGFLRPDRGEVFIYDTDLTGLDRVKLDRVRRQVGYVFEDSALVSNLKAIENVALPLLYHTSMGRDESMEKALELLESVSYRGDIWALPGVLPMYEKKLVAVARALALSPDLVVFEHLEAGLTSEERSHIAEILKGYHNGEAGRLLLFTTSNREDGALIEAGREVMITDHGFSG